MRVNQYIAHASGMSRRAADKAIHNKQVTVNGEVASNGLDINDTDIVELDHQPATLPDYQLIMLNKPVGYITSRKQQGAAPTIYDLLPPDMYGLKPVGRLDKDSSGLLLLTNNGELAQTLQHPSSGKWKRYEVTLTQPLTAISFAKLEAGVPLDDGISRLKLKYLDGQKRNVEVLLQEGRNRQIRRSFNALGYAIKTLHRTTFGDYALQELKPGAWQNLAITDL